MSHKQGREVSFDVVSHWIWATMVFLLLLSGLAIVGARYSWILGDHFAFADILHRVTGVFWVIWVSTTVVYEVSQLATKPASKRVWLPLGKSGFAAFNFIVTLLLILSGFLLWFMPAVPFGFAVISFVIHEFFAFVILFVIVWHIGRKRHIFQLPLLKRKRVTRK